MGWYRTGTINVTNGSAAVVGVGTNWVAEIGDGWALVAPDGKVYEVLTVNSATSLTLGSIYIGSSASGQPYACYPTQSKINDLAKQAAQLVADFAHVLTGAGAGKFADGTSSAPGIAFASDPDTGFHRVASNVMALIAGAVEQLRVETDGVGIGAAAGTNGRLFIDFSDTSKPAVRVRNNVSGGVVQDWQGAGATVVARMTTEGNFLNKMAATVPSLDIGEVVWNFTSNTNVRISARGSDGVVRVANIAIG